MNNTITEIISDDWPEWAIESMAKGQLFNDCLAKLEKYKWISVKDRCPDGGVNVLAHHKDWGIEISYHTGSGIPIGLLEDKATHWMELPEVAGFI